MFKPRLYWHFKGGLYLLLAEDVRHCDTQQDHCLYLGIPSMRLWIRPVSEFFGCHKSGAVRFQERKPFDGNILDWVKGEGPDPLPTEKE